MKLPQQLLAGWTYLCLATLLAEAGLLAVLAQRGMMTPHTIEHLLTVAYDIPVRDIYDQLEARNRPAEREMVSLADIREARMLASLDLDLREMAADKGYSHLRELDGLVEQENDRYARMKDEFDRRWEQLQQDTMSAELQELRRQIESLAPKLAKDQLLRILDDPQLDPDLALQYVVAIFKNLPVDKRKKLVVEFKDPDSARLHAILREVREGLPQAALLRDARDQLRQFPDPPAPPIRDPLDPASRPAETAGGSVDAGRN